MYTVSSRQMIEEMSPNLGIILHMPIIFPHKHADNIFLLYTLMYYERTPMHPHNSTQLSTHTPTRRDVAASVAGPVLGGPLFGLLACIHFKDSLIL